MQVAINPTNLLNVVGFTHNLANLQELSVYRSTDGGSTWSRTVISRASDGLGTGASGDMRFDPTLQFDALGHLFIAYGFYDGSKATTETARNDDGGTTFSQFRAPDSNTDPVVAGKVLPGVDKWFLTTGLDPSSGGQAGYIAYTRNVLKMSGLDQQVT